jgi:ParB family chromosome partitioning protein
MSAKRKNALGRGLGALLDDSTSYESQVPQKTWTRSGISEIIISEIATNPFQPRSHFNEESLKQLADSIATQGIIQPITVRKLSAGKYQLIAGERRLQASKMTGLTKIPAFIRAANDQQMLEMALIENIQREDLNAIEIALSYQRLITECDLKQEELGTRVGKNRSTVTNYMRLLKLPPEIQAGLRDKKISMGHARALINIDNIDAQLEVYRRILTNDLNVRQVEALVKLIGTGEKITKGTKVSKATNPEIIKLQSRLSSHFGTKVVVNSDQKNKGEIKIPFISVQDLNRILEILDVSL